MTETEFEEMAERFCDEYCKFQDLFTPEELEAVCDGCPLTGLEKLRGDAQ